MVSREELRQIADGAIQALESAEQETKELHEILCAMDDDYNVSLADGRDREAIQEKRAKFKSMQKKVLLSHHITNVYAECKEIIGLFDELDG